MTPKLVAFLNLRLSQGSNTCCASLYYNTQNVVSGILRWKNFENWFTFGEVMIKHQLSCFLSHSV